MKIKIHLDQKRYSRKPQQRDVIEINKSIIYKLQNVKSEILLIWLETMDRHLCLD